MGKQFWREREKKEAEALGEKEPEDFLAGDSSYLLDSYNRLGEYSTLAKGQGLEGKFRALG